LSKINAQDPFESFLNPEEASHPQRWVRKDSDCFKTDIFERIRLQTVSDPYRYLIP